MEDRWWEKIRWREIGPPDEPEDKYMPGWSVMWDAVYRLQGEGYDPEGRIGFIDELRLDLLALTDVVNEGHDITKYEIYPVFEYVIHRWAELVKSGRCGWIDLGEARANYSPTHNRELIRDIGFTPDRIKHWWWYVLED